MTKSHCSCLGKTRWPCRTTLVRNLSFHHGYFLFTPCGLGDSALCGICKVHGKQVYFSDIVDAVRHVHREHEVLGGSQIVMLGMGLCLLTRLIILILPFLSLRRRQNAQIRLPQSDRPGAWRGSSSRGFGDDGEGCDGEWNKPEHYRITTKSRHSRGSGKHPVKLPLYYNVQSSRSLTRSY